MSEQALEIKQEWYNWYLETLTKDTDSLMSYEDWLVSELIRVRAERDNLERVVEGS